ncbi:hypothetical protein [Desulfonatronum sp. SC1]|uniref:hypothetical protein n=1 Tax=Desulfonatronum sp. SC1 TaxID=2109626 RepID=UPI001E622C83|nr:hypothetical protein [Desulfonatronum sp. SC1]
MPKVLIADDSMFQRFALTKAVKGLCYEIIEAKNGQECLDAMAESAPSFRNGSTIPISARPCASRSKTPESALPP